MISDLKFNEIVIDTKTHTLISGDADTREIMSHDISMPFEENVSPDYRELFLRKLEEADNKWFPVEIMTKRGNDYFYVRANRTTNGTMIMLKAVNISKMLDSHLSTIHLVNSYKAQLDLFNDVFFEFDPATDCVELFNTESAFFDSGRYSIDEFEVILSKKAGFRQKQTIHSFINQIKNKTGRFSLKVDCNLLNDDRSFKNTLLEGSFVFFDKDSEGVVGHIHPERAGGRFVPPGIRHDSLTGLVDKSDIISIARERIDEKAMEGTTLVIVDIDFFKNVNDNYGHQFGDNVIKKVADMISTEVGSDGIVGRFGGDEFLVIFYNIKNEDQLRKYLRHIKNTVAASFPDKGPDEKTPLSISVGAATYPQDAHCYDDLFMVADHCLYIAKSKGRNRYIIYTPEKHGSLESIRIQGMNPRRLNERDMTYGDVIVKMFDNTLHGNAGSPEQIMEEFAKAFELQRISLFVGEPFKFRYSAGTEAMRGKGSSEFLLGMLNSEIKQKYIGDQTFIVVNRIDSLPAQAGSMKDFLKEKGILSYVLIRFFDRDKRECILVITSIGKQTQWNQSHYKYYRALGDILSLYSLKV